MAPPPNRLRNPLVWLGAIWGIAALACAVTGGERLASDFQRALLSGATCSMSVDDPSGMESVYREYRAT